MYRPKYDTQWLFVILGSFHIWDRTSVRSWENLQTNN